MNDDYDLLSTPALEFLHQFFPSANEDLQDFLTHPQHWAGTDVILRRDDKLSVLHYNALLERYYWYPLTRGRRDSRLGRDELCTQLVNEGWRLDAKR